MNGDQGAQKLGKQYTPNDGSDAGAAVPQKVSQATPTQQAVVPTQAPAPQPSGGFYRADQSDDVSAPAPDVPEPLADGTAPQDEISWTAGDAAVRAHATAWRLRMIGLSILLGLAVLFVTGGDWFPAGSIVVAGVLFGLLGSRRSQVLAYRVDARGVMIGQKHYAYSEFRAFSVFGDRSSSSIELVPLQRFMPAVLLYLDQVQGQQIVDTLSGYLPMQPHRQDVVDYIINRVKI